MNNELLSEIFREEDALLEQQLLDDGRDHEQWTKEQEMQLHAALERHRELHNQLKDVRYKTVEQGKELNKLLAELQVWFAEIELEQQEELANNPDRRISRRSTMKQYEEDEDSDLELDQPTPIPTSLLLKADEFDAKKTCLGRFVTGGEFNALSTTVIVLNAFFIGYSVQHAIDHVGEPQNLTILHIEWTFYAFYLVELVLKLLVFGRYFFFDVEWKWNLFDLLLVIMAFYDVTMYLITEHGVIDSGSTNVTWLRLLRLLKMLKMLRVVRVVRFFRELRLMFNSITTSFRSLFWAMVMLLLVMYIFALCFIQGASMYIIDTKPKDISFEVEESLFIHWTTVFDALNTLFMAVSGGTDWVNPLIACKAMGWFYEFLFLFYILFVTVAVLNVLTGIFVDAAIDAAELDRDTVIRESMQTHAAKAKWVAEQFFEVEEDGSLKDSITKEEFERRLENPDIVTRLNLLDIDTSEAQWLFKELDTSGDNEVSSEELGEGLLKLKGMARSIDMVSLQHEFHTHGKQMTQFMQFTSDSFQAIGRKMKKQIPMPVLETISATRRP